MGRLENQQADIVQIFWANLEQKATLVRKVIKGAAQNAIETIDLGFKQKNLKKWMEKNHVKRLERDFKPSRNPKEVATLLYTLKQNHSRSYLREAPHLNQKKGKFAKKPGKS